jgi:pilus assembly protein Flp/PilA
LPHHRCHASIINPEIAAAVEALRVVPQRSAPSIIEYGLIAALISVVIIGTITAVGTQLTKTFTAVSTALSTANN